MIVDAIVNLGIWDAPQNPARDNLGANGLYITYISCPGSSASLDRGLNGKKNLLGTGVHLLIASCIANHFGHAPVANRVFRLS